MIEIADNRREFEVGDELVFSVILFGRAIGLLPFLIAGCRQWGSIGIGRGRSKFSLESVAQVDLLNGHKIVLFNGDSIVSDGGHEVSGSECIQEWDESANGIRIDFRTPLRVKTRGMLIRKPEFGVLMREVLIRISTLAYFHCGFTLDIPYRQIVERASEIGICQHNVVWTNLERYSNRQKTHLKIDGLTGWAIYQGDFSAFFPFLCLARYTHIGKGTVFGLGEIDVTMVSQGEINERILCS